MVTSLSWLYNNKKRGLFTIKTIFLQKEEMDEGA
jgi:hypothetical protein